MTDKEKLEKIEEAFSRIGGVPHPEEDWDLEELSMIRVAYRRRWNDPSSTYRIVPEGLLTDPRPFVKACITYRYMLLD